MATHDRIQPRIPALRKFLESEAAGGLLLMAAAALAIIVANSPLGDTYFSLLHHAVGPTLTAKLGPMTAHLWINDGLMAVFFLLVGLEIKREFVDGRLQTWDQRRLPALPALLGMAFPALIYVAIVRDTPDLLNGWAIPAATDIAFAVGVLALLGKRAPLSLKLLLVTIAILDDVGAVAIIAIFYTAEINIVALAAALAVFGFMIALNRLRVLRLWPYLLCFVVLWYAMLLSGIHATIAGVMAAMTIPVVSSPDGPDSSHSPLHRLEHAIAPWVGFLIVPVFGFANAGVSLSGTDLAAILAPLPLGVAAGLFVGKQLGVFGGIVIAVKSGIAARPRGATWLQIYAVSMMCGIGFTMSLFISGLAFYGQPEFVDATKIGILIGSLLSAIVACAILRFAPPAPDAASEESKQRVEILKEGDVDRL